MKRLLFLAALLATPALASPAGDRARAAIAELEAVPVAAPAGEVPRVASYNPITARVGVPRAVYVGSLTACPCTYNQPLRGSLSGSGVSLTYTARSAGQDDFAVRGADGRLVAYFVSVFQ